jgi:DNA-binding PadR family transcriptional regulator
LWNLSGSARYLLNTKPEDVRLTQGGKKEWQANMYGTNAAAIENTILMFLQSKQAPIHFTEIAQAVIEKWQPAYKAAGNLLSISEVSRLMGVLKKRGFLKEEIHREHQIFRLTDNGREYIERLFNRQESKPKSR